MFLLLTLFFTYSQQTTLIQPVTIIQDYNTACVADGQCCGCSRLDNCDQNNNCVCGSDSFGEKYYGQTCLLTNSEWISVTKQQIPGADETLIASFSTFQVYDFLKSKNTTSTTIKQLQAVVDLAKSKASSTTQISEVDWYLKIIQLIAVRVNAITTLETSTKQSFQINLIDLIRVFMYKRISLDTLEAPFKYEQTYYSAQISKWKDTTNFTKMNVNGKSFNTAQCEYKWRSVLIKYMFIVSVADEMINSFTNSSFTYNSTVTYCMFMKKAGDAYFPPSSEFHYQQYIPPFDYESLLKTSNVTALGCYQIKLDSSAYKLYYNDQECQYKSIASNRLVPYCQCNEPGYTFVQALYSVSKTYGFILKSVILWMVIMIV